MVLDFIGLLGIFILVVVNLVFYIHVWKAGGVEAAVNYFNEESKRIRRERFARGQELFVAIESQEQIKELFKKNLAIMETLTLEHK